MPNHTSVRSCTTSYLCSLFSLTARDKPWAGGPSNHTPTHTPPDHGSRITTGEHGDFVRHQQVCSESGRRVFAQSLSPDFQGGLPWSRDFGLVLLSRASWQDFLKAPPTPPLPNRIRHLGLSFHHALSLFRVISQTLPPSSLFIACSPPDLSPVPTPTLFISVTHDSHTYVVFLGPTVITRQSLDLMPPGERHEKKKGATQQWFACSALELESVCVLPFFPNLGKAPVVQPLSTATLPCSTQTTGTNQIIAAR